ncbi:MAG: hypothetical protein ACHRXM_01270 [Isosphaerales bacterium]
MALTDWNQTAPTEYLNIEVHLRRDTRGNLVGEINLPLGENFRRVLPEPPYGELVEVGRAAFHFGEPAVQMYGRRLFEWLFGEGLREGFQKVRMMVADSSRSRWRLHIRLGQGLPEQLHALRWESMHYTKDEWWLGLETAFARTSAASGFGSSLLTDRPFRLMAAATTATNQVEQPALHLNSLLSTFNKTIFRPLGQLITQRFAYPPLTFRQLTEFFEGSKDDGCHFAVICGRVGAENGRPFFWFDTEAGESTPVDWNDVVDVIDKPRAPALILILAQPSGTSWDPTRLPLRLAPDCIKRGTRGVLEVVGPMSDEDFRTFGEAFFTRFLQTGAVDDAVAAGRRELFTANPHGWEWTYPVLTLHSSDDAQQFYLLPESLESMLGSIKSRAR